jgi:transposase-like protein
MTSAGVVAKALIEEHSDFLRESVAMIAAQIMEAEIARQVGAGKGEVSEARSTHRNGYRQRPWATRVGEIELAVPRKRSGESYFPSFLEPRKRSEKALLGVVMEAYVNGVSTRKVDHLVSELGIHMSKDQVSRICGELDEQVEAFRTRPLEGAYPYLWLDAKHLKVRELRARALQGADGRLRGARERSAGGDRHRDRRVGDRGGLGGLPARAGGPRPGGGEALRLR